MDTKLCEYIVSIAESGNAAKAAAKLYISQSALNQQLQKLEDELKAPLFYRQRNHWILTEVGQLYVDNAKKMISIKQETYDRIGDLAENWNRTITIGLTAERGMQMFAGIHGILHRKYPDTMFQPIDATVEQQNHLIENGQIDLGFQTICERSYKHFHYQRITCEPFILCIPYNHPLASHGSRSSKTMPQIDLSLFKNDVFTIVKRNSTMRPVVDKLFQKAGFKPKLLFESAGMRAMQKIVSSGECCSIIPRYYAVPDPRVAYFALGEDASWELVAVSREDKYLSRAARDFIQTANAYWQEHLWLDS